MNNSCRAERVRVVWKAALTRLNGERFSGSTDNVSVTGLNVIVGRGLVLGEPVKIDMVTSCRQGTCYFKLEGVVVYSRQLDQGLGHAVGLQLMCPVASYLELVGSLSHANEARGVA